MTGCVQGDGGFHCERHYTADNRTSIEETHHQRQNQVHVFSQQRRFKKKTPPTPEIKPGKNKK